MTGPAQLALAWDLPPASAAPVTEHTEQTHPAPAPTCMLPTPPQRLPKPKLWLALHFPELILEAVLTGQGQGSSAAAKLKTTTAIAIYAADERQQRLLFCNPLARKKGLTPGMPLASAWSLCPELHALARAPEAETAALQRLAQWAGQFTPTVSLRPPNSLLLEVQASLHLFGGSKGLLEKIHRQLRARQLRAYCCLSPTPLAALWLAQAGIEAGVTADMSDGDGLRRQLEQLPIEQTGLAPSTRQQLQRIGAETLSDVLRLPRAGLARRYGRDLLPILDRALGLRPDLPTLYAPEPRFSARLELSHESSSVEVLMQAVELLVQDLCGQLQRQQKAVERLQLRLEHDREHHTKLTIGLLQASSQTEQLLQLLRLRLEASPLPAPVRELRLRSGRWLAPTAVAADFFCARQSSEALALVLEKLGSRLGTEAIFCVQAARGHGPEHLSQARPPGEQHAPGPRSLRPLLLLTPPQTLGSETPAGMFLRGPERIESAWWQHNADASSTDSEICRDYFVLQTPAGSCWWVFRERKAPYAWFKHGLFA